MKAIAMFNNKGGVGKTTLTCNLSAYIARTGKKVMLIDADPQCNSTIYCFTDDLFSKVYYDKKGFTIYDVIKPVNQGIGYVKNVEVYNLEKFGFDFWQEIRNLHFLKILWHLIGAQRYQGENVELEQH